MRAGESMKKSIRILEDSFSFMIMDRKYDFIKCDACLKNEGRNDDFQVYLGYGSWADPEIECVEDRGLCLFARCSICKEWLQVAKLKVSWSDIEWVKA